MKEGKLTLPAIHAVLRGGDPEMKTLALKIRRQQASPSDIQRMVDYTRQQNGIAYAEWAMQEFQYMAAGLVPEDGDPAIREALHAYIDYVAGRIV